MDRVGGRAVGNERGRDRGDRLEIALTKGCKEKRRLLYHRP